MSHAPSCPNADVRHDEYHGHVGALSWDSADTSKVMAPSTNKRLLILDTGWSELVRDVDVTFTEGGSRVGAFLQSAVTL